MISRIHVKIVGKRAGCGANDTAKVSSRRHVSRDHGRARAIQ